MRSVKFAVPIFCDTPANTLGGRVIGLQPKDVIASEYSAPGAGLMNYPALFAQLARIGPVPVIVQDASEEHAARVRADLVRWYDQASVPD